ncbi:MAG: SDR family NAD(P)-dependent oxidoreductase [Alphaproteobacteria bacterium]
MSHQGKTAIITGAGQGIGRVYAQRFAEAGANVVIAEVNERNGQAVAADIEAKGGKVLAVKTDVADEKSVVDMVSATVEKFGGADILINNAAMFTRLSRGVFDTLPVDEWRRVMDVNVTGAFLCARAVLPHMRKKKWGRIVNISSGTVTMGRPDYLHYVTSKSAAIGMTRAMAREIGKDGITVNVLLPGLTRTEIDAEGITDQVWNLIKAKQCIPREETPDDLAKVALFVTSDDAAFITGQSFAVDGGVAHI